MADQGSLDLLKHAGVFSSFHGNFLRFAMACPKCDIFETRREASTDIVQESWLNTTTGKLQIFCYFVQSSKFLYSFDLELVRRVIEPFRRAYLLHFHHIPFGNAKPFQALLLRDIGSFGCTTGLQFQPHGRVCHRKQL